MLKKYSKYRHEIRVHGNTGNVIFEKKDDMGNLYVDCYHIDTKEGLIYFLSEYDYYYKQVVYTEKFRKKLYRKQKEIIALVNEKMLQNGNPYITTEQWVEDHFMKEKGNFEYTQEIFKYVKEFDSVINPFSGKYNMKNPIEYVDDVILNLYYEHKNFFRMIISNEKCRLSHLRDVRGEDDYITYTFEYSLDKNMAMEVHHYISANKNENVICFYRCSRIGYGVECDRLDIRYDLLSNNAYATYEGNKLPITYEQKEVIVSELKKAIKEASKFTIKYMTKK